MGDQRLRIAFADIANRDWGAGAVYYANLLAALGTLPDAAQPHTSVVTWPEHRDSASDWPYRALADELIEVPPAAAPSFARRQLARIKRRVGIGQSPGDTRTADLLRSRGIDALFACWMEFGPAFDVPLLGWIPDFQHLHLPNLFSAQENQFRDDLFGRMAQNCSVVVLSSQHARKDFARFSPAHAAKAQVLQFVAQVSPSIYVAEVDVCATYNLPQRFVYLPNQFWAHKNHTLVVDALAQLKARHPEVVVVCTGHTSDNRNAAHVGELLSRVSRLGVRDNFIVLGLVPHEHIFALMRQSLAVLQPSRFEGWSTTVEEAKSLGKSILLSDIAVHREQAPPGGVYFNPADADGLAGRLVEVFQTKMPGPDVDRELDARAALPSRTRAYATNFVRIVEAARKAS